MIGIVVACALAANNSHYSFRVGGEWVVLDDSGRVAGRYLPPTPEPVVDAEVSPDGSAFVLSIGGKESPGRLVMWKVGATNVEPFVDETGFYGAPRFSRDGRWVFVAHYPKTGGPPGEHEPMQYAQLYRIDVKNRDMRRMTDSNGCHMASFSSDGKTVIFGHSTCRGAKFIEQFTTGDSAYPEETRLIETGGLLDEPALSGNGKILVYTQTNGNRVELMAKWPTALRVLFSGMAVGPLRPRITATNLVLFQDGSRVLSVSLDKPTQQAVVIVGAP